jgi:hypothetical protein
MDTRAHHTHRPALALLTPASQRLAPGRPLSQDAFSSGPSDEIPRGEFSPVGRQIDPRPRACRTRAARRSVTSGHTDGTAGRIKNVMPQPAPLARIADTAEAIVFLPTPKASYISGAYIPVDLGRTAAEHPPQAHDPARSRCGPIPASPWTITTGAERALCSPDPASSVAISAARSSSGPWAKMSGVVSVSVGGLDGWVMLIAAAVGAPVAWRQSRRPGRLAFARSDTRARARVRRRRDPNPCRPDASQCRILDRRNVGRVVDRCCECCHADDDEHDR